MCLCLVFTFFIGCAKFKSVAKPCDSETNLCEIELLCFPLFNTLTPLRKDMRARPTIPEGVHNDVLRFGMLMTAAQVKRLNYEGKTMRNFHVVPWLFKGEEYCPDLTLNERTRVC